MPAVVHDERTLTGLDHARLSKLRKPGQLTPLGDWFESVEVTSSRTVTSDLVTMNSRVEMVDVDTRRRQVLTVCYPDDAAPAIGFVSVLSPVGSSVIGLKTGDVAKWLTPLGEACAAEIAAIQYQPEAAGHHTQ